jgi:hypothetical protein
MGTKTQKLSNVVDQIVEWQSVFTGDGSTGLTAVAGRGYFIDTTSGTVTVTLPASPKIGDTIQINDYAGTFGTNSVTLGRNGSNINGTAANGGLSSNSQTATLVFLDSTRGWQTVSNSTPESVAPQFIAATGGTVTTSGDFKIHSFTGDGCFVVSQIGGGGPLDGPSIVDYLVVAGGGGGGAGCGAGGGGGAGGYRFYANPTCNPQSGPGAPRNGPAGITVSTTTYPVTVGAGGAGGLGSPATCGSNGNNSVFSTITSTAGGGAGSGNTGPSSTGNPGGSGGGATRNRGTGGTGNTPPVSPPQGNNGGDGTDGLGGDGGGGAMVAGSNNSPPGVGGSGGAGAGITGFGAGNGECSACVQYFSGGGGGGNFSGCAATPKPGGAAGLGGGGRGALYTTLPAPAAPTGEAGTANTGGGGGGGSEVSAIDTDGGAGGSGIVVIRYKFQ